jgi:hypothetical protein
LVLQRDKQLTGFKLLELPYLPCCSPGVQTLETLLPGLQIDIELLKASDWAKLVVSVKETANRIVLLKTLYPRADLTAIVQRMPSALLWSAEELQENAIQVCDGEIQWGSGLCYVRGFSVYVQGVLWTVQSALLCIAEKLHGQLCKGACSHAGGEGGINLTSRVRSMPSASLWGAEELQEIATPLRRLGVCVGGEGGVTENMERLTWQLLFMAYCLCCCGVRQSCWQKAVQVGGGGLEGEGVPGW